jgi:hypothetical protein
MKQEIGGKPAEMLPYLTGTRTKPSHQGPAFSAHPFPFCGLSIPDDRPVYKTNGGVKESLLLKTGLWNRSRSELREREREREGT